MTPSNVAQTAHMVVMAASVAMVTTSTPGAVRVVAACSLVLHFETFRAYLEAILRTIQEQEQEGMRRK